ncbi:alkaline phosphatase family protein [Acetivibrio cellulolyticus]|uniref:alkaline phosphatase family protein n=1 Tax=Acetivibrio cellulolyticus TaxID=35830 RepID=UPI0004750B5C|nr:alkaline phosphatase family protein [Acetivibrio cellulolyticus]
MKMIFIFIDGFGMGEADSDKNPIYRANTPALDYILKVGKVMATDACLGIPGLPQSATGQTSIFTGINAPEILGRHLHGQPTVSLKRLINKNNLFMELLRRGLKVTNANAYRAEYLNKMLDPKERKFRPSVTTVMTLASGLNCRTVEEYKLGKGVYHDITSKILVEGGYVENTISPEKAAQRLFNISREYDFTMFEHFMTDIIGHKMDMEEAVLEIELLDTFLGALIRFVNLDEDVIFITSDHGNIEDITVKTHTFNKVPTVILGRADRIASVKVETLVDVMPAVLKIFETSI